MPTDTTRKNEILHQLKGQFPGVVAVSPGQALMASGRTSSSDPDRAARLAIYRGSFPFRVEMMGKRRRVLLTDMAEVLAGACAPAPAAAGAAQEVAHHG